MLRRKMTGPFLFVLPARQAISEKSLRAGDAELAV
jgi:hypothetical protein